ncbi:MAG: bifunctional phosphopantothenoylcysteine decarboxylase/phosphopantothenate--cysteine ligase CoaBC [Paramuribaculum sp.]|nr:bifunctional phosphopantothenoylcysteine decarboxylase/phosphopantothenate--cysteine ligase CoaBC [Paramuribaculum sp.]MDE6488798.1 bifunctional phosphopantothenoylcysteine decarboxylase/phosphopantothenate--cysteine ligase CoaBC [Paramuribaculum sp.]
MLNGKHIILGITGGIAAYKSALLVRLLIKRGAEVQVVMTPSAKEFITPVTLSALTGKPVVSEFFTANTGEWHSHVDLGLWADAMVIAPATACTIGKMANGVADNMLVTTYLSAKAPVFVAPAMDLDMMAHPSTTRNLELLRSYGNHVIEPASGELASHLVGRGRMEEPENIVRVLDDYFASSSRLAGKKVLITAGPTYERIDPVRFIGNFSTGKMGYALADAAARAGAEVTVVSGPVSVRPKESSVKVIPVESACQMADRCMEIFPQTDIAIMCAAVADYAPAEQLDKKLKRGNCETMTLELRRNPDIAAMLGKNKRDGQILVGFALETDNEEFNACRKMESKNLDLIVLNSLAVPGAGFATDTNAVSVFFADGRRTDIPLMSKADVAGKIISLL